MGCEDSDGRNSEDTLQDKNSLCLMGKRSVSLFPLLSISPLSDTSAGKSRPTNTCPSSPVLSPCLSSPLSFPPV